MKSIKNIFGLGLSFMLALVLMASCSSDDDYTPADVLKNAQVYFPNTNEDYVELASDAKSFDVTLSRVKTDEELTVNIVCDSVPKGYSVPSSVTFPKGEKTAKITIAYEFDSLGYDNPSEMTLKIAEDKYTTPYGMSEYTFTSEIPAPWTEWISTKDAWVKAGYEASAWPLSDSESTGTYTYVNYWSGDDTDRPISYRISKIDPTQAQFKMEGVMYGIDLVLNYNTETNIITIDPQWTGYNNSSYGPVYVTDAVNYWGNIAANKSDLSGNANYQSYFDPEEGKFYLRIAYYVTAGTFGYDYETFQCNGFYIPDYSAITSYAGVLTAADGKAYAQVNVALGADAENVQALVVNSSDDADAVAEAMKSGDVESTIVAGSGVVNVPIGDYTGALKVVVASFDADTVAQDVEQVEFEYYGGGKNPWVSLGTGQYTDDALITLFTNSETSSAYEPVTYSVEIKENSETPGLYRIMNPYSNSVYPYADNDCAAEGYYLEINATDPEAVYMEQQSLHFDWIGKGEMSLVSNGARYLANYDVATLKSYGYLGKMVDGKLVLPSFSRKNSAGEVTGYYQGLIYSGTSGYYAGRNGKMTFTLPSAVTASAKQYAKVSTAKARVRAAINKALSNEVKLPSGRLLCDKKLVKNVSPMSSMR